MKASKRTVMLTSAIVIAAATLLLWATTSRKAERDTENVETGKGHVGSNADTMLAERTDTTGESAYGETERPSPPPADLVKRPWMPELDRWGRDRWGAITNGIIESPESRLDPDSAEAVEYVQIALTKRNMQNVEYTSTVDVYDKYAIVAFRRVPPPPKPGVNRKGWGGYAIIIDISTKMAVGEHMF